MWHGSTVDETGDAKILDRRAFLKNEPIAKDWFGIAEQSGC
jgi:hypothetical protein